MNSELLGDLVAFRTAALVLLSFHRSFVVAPYLKSPVKQFSEVCHRAKRRSLTVQIGDGAQRTCT